jgi:hypothetical protein
MTTVSSGSPIEVGYGEQIITPPMGIDLSGYGFYLNRRAESVLDDLKARALFLRKGTDHLVIISCDLIGVSVEYADSVRRNIASSLLIPTCQVMFACTHTHSGPATMSALGLGNMDRAYMTRLSQRIAEAVTRSFDDAQPAKFSFSEMAIEPIGFNRRTKTFHPIDPVLKLAAFARSSDRVFLASYACHPVTLGPTKGVSADWPGALVRELENRGDRCVFLQGCAADIDPVTNMNRWGKGTEEDLEHYGMLVADWVRRMPESQIEHGSARLKAAERRVCLPLSIWSRRDIEREASLFAKEYGHFPGSSRFAREWKKLALEQRTDLARHPSIDGAPLQVLEIGDLRLVGIPGEVFCEIGLKLQSKWPHTWALSLVNGAVGYIPTRHAYQKRDDYACYCAPRFLTTFPFTPDVERVVLHNCDRVLRSVGSH